MFRHLDLDPAGALQSAFEALEFVHRTGQKFAAAVQLAGGSSPFHRLRERLQPFRRNRRGRPLQRVRLRLRAGPVRRLDPLAQTV